MWHAIMVWVHFSWQRSGLFGEARHTWWCPSLYIILRATWTTRMRALECRLVRSMCPSRVRDQDQRVACIRRYSPLRGDWFTQLSNLWWITNSVCKGFDTAMKTGSSRRFKWYPTTYKWVSSWLFFTVDYGLSWFILILSKGKLTWHSLIGCGVSFESS